MPGHNCIKTNPKKTIKTRYMDQVDEVFGTKSKQEGIAGGRGGQMWNLRETENF